MIWFSDNGFQKNGKVGRVFMFLFLFSIQHGKGFLFCFYFQLFQNKTQNYCIGVHSAGHLDDLRFGRVQNSGNASLNK